MKKFNTKNIVRKNMNCSFKIPRSNDEDIVSLSGPFDLRADIDAVGAYTIDFKHSTEYIKTTYISDIACGDCPSRFYTKHNDDKETEYMLDMKVRDKNKPSYTREFFSEYFREDYSTISIPRGDMSSKTNFTKIEVFGTDINLNIEINKKILTKDSTTAEIRLDNGSIAVISVKWIITEPNEFGITEKVFNGLTVRVADGSNNKTNYLGFKFYNYIDVGTLLPVLEEEYHYLKLNDRTMDIPYVEEKPVVVDPYPDFDNPTDFIEGTVPSPEAPESSSQTTDSYNVVGDMFFNTMAHNEKLADNTSSLKIGTNLPAEAVNLGFYYNKTASYENALSVVETSTNSVTLKSIEQWEHKTRIKNKDESLFRDFIEFNGEENTPLEGYWGVLYREYIAWDEVVDLDQEPEYIKEIEIFEGLTSKHIPDSKRHKKDKKNGVLKLTHTVFTATRFNKDKTPRTWNCYAIYEGYVRLNTILYNGSAKFAGIITKKDGMSNLDPEQPRELLLYANDLGILEDNSGNSEIDDDLFLITDKFKDNAPLYYKHKLKHRIYSNNENTTVSLVLENSIPFIVDEYKYIAHLEETGTKNVYDCYIYTNFLISSSSPVYVLYQGMIGSGFNVTGLTTTTGIKEKLSLMPAINEHEYEVIRSENMTKRAKIKMFEFDKINDNRNKMNIKFFVECEGLRSREYTIGVLNKKYATIEELKRFINDSMIISPRNNNGFLTAKDVLFRDISELDREKIEGNKRAIYKVLLDLSDIETFNSENKVIITTDTSGSGFLFARTYENTGLKEDDEDNLFEKELPKNSIFMTKGDYLYKGYSVKCKNVNQIIVAAPKEDNKFKSWLPGIKFSYFTKVYERLDKTIRLVYTVPEFNTQVFGKYGKPYIDVEKEKVRKIGERTIKVKNKDLYIRESNKWYPDSIKVYKEVDGELKHLTISSYFANEGVIETLEEISDNDTVFCDYSYEERFYKYRGYYENGDKNSKIIKVNLNPSDYSSYIDTRNEFYKERKSYELFNRTIHFFLKPTRIIDEETGKVEEDNKFCIYHKFDDQRANGSFDLHIGRIFMRHYASLKSTELIDARTRGGGILQTISDSLRKEFEEESEFYLDISSFDGKPYQENSVLLIRIDNKILKSNGGYLTEDDVERKVNRWKAYGSYVIIEYVDIVEDYENPNSTMKIEREITNSFKYTTLFSVEVEE